MMTPSAKPRKQQQIQKQIMQNTRNNKIEKLNTYSHTDTITRTTYIANFFLKEQKNAYTPC